MTRRMLRHGVRFAMLAALLVLPSFSGAATHLRWSQSGSNVDGFRIYIQDGSGDLTLLRDLGAQVPVDGIYSYPLLGLIDEPSYLAMSAYNEAGESDLTAPRLVTPPPLCTSDVDCAIQDQCRMGVCGVETGCGTLNVADGTSCDDGNSSTSGDQCVAGVCSGSAPTAPPGNVSIGSITPSAASGIVGQPLSFLVSSTGTGTPLYRWLVSREGGNWSVLRDYSTSPLLAWTPQLAGNHRIGVSAKTVGAAGEQDWEAVAFAVSAAGCTAVQMVEPAGPVVQRMPVLVAASDAGACEYRFRLFRDGRPVLTLRGFDSDPSFLWVPRVPAGAYEIGVEVRDAGASQSLGYTTMPLDVSEAQLLECSASAGMINCSTPPSELLEYQWWLIQPGSRRPRVLHAFGEMGDTISIPAASGSGTYRVIVWTRPAEGSGLRRGLVYRAREAVTP